MGAFAHRGRHLVILLVAKAELARQRQGAGSGIQRPDLGVRVECLAHGAVGREEACDVDGAAVKLSVPRVAAHCVAAGGLACAGDKWQQVEKGQVSGICMLSNAGSSRVLGAWGLQARRQRREGGGGRPTGGSCILLRIEG